MIIFWVSSNYVVPNSSDTVIVHHKFHSMRNVYLLCFIYPFSWSSCCFYEFCLLDLFYLVSFLNFYACCVFLVLQSFIYLVFFQLLHMCCLLPLFSSQLFLQVFPIYIILVTSSGFPLAFVICVLSIFFDLTTLFH